MLTHPYLASALARERQRGPFPQAQPPGRPGVMNHTAAARSQSRKGEPPWPP